jgi:hypothetical protein
MEGDHVGAVPRRQSAEPAAEPEEIRRVARCQRQRVFQAQAEHLHAVVHRLRHGEISAGERAVVAA